MAKSRAGIFRFVAVVLLMLAIAGCATTADRKVTLHYEPAVHATGGAGELYLARGSETPLSGANQAVQWVIGSIKDRDGNMTGSVVTDTMPVDLVLQAFNAELIAAGYSVIRVSEVPPQAAKGISISNVAITLDEVSSLVKAEAKSSLKVSVEVWREGKKVSRLTYETVNSDTTVTGRDEFLQEILGKTMNNLMSEAVPAVVKVLEQK
jgi:hypothetical protein